MAKCQYQSKYVLSGSTHIPPFGFCQIGSILAHFIYKENLIFQKNSVLLFLIFLFANRTISEYLTKTQSLFDRNHSVIQLNITYF